MSAIIQTIMIIPIMTSFQDVGKKWTHSKEIIGSISNENITKIEKGSFLIIFIISLTSFNFIKILLVFYYIGYFA